MGTLDTWLFDPDGVLNVFETLDLSHEPGGEHARLLPILVQTISLRRSDVLVKSAFELVTLNTEK